MKYKSKAKKAIYSCSYSMADVLKIKNLGKILEMKAVLRRKIFARDGNEHEAAV